MRTSNPFLKENTFTELSLSGDANEVMTLQGTINKSFILIALVLFSAFISWKLYLEGAVFVMPLVIGGAIGGFVVALITIFKKEWSPITAPIYALFEGLFLGAISAVFETSFPGIVLQAIMLTMGVFLCLLFVYKLGLVKATENFRLGIMAATGAVGLVYLIGFIGSFFGWEIPYIHESGWIGIGFSLVVVVIAALNLVLDFDFIEHGVENNAPKYMEWFASFGLILTLVWLYLEILRLLMKLRGRD